MLEKVWRKESPPTLLGMYVGTVTMKKSMKFPPKTKNRVIIWSSNPTSRHISRQNYNSERYMHLYVHSSTSHSRQNREITLMSIDGWMDKEDVVCVCVCVCVCVFNIHTMEYYLVIKKECVDAICSNMDVTKDYHTKWSKSETKI